MLDWLTKKLKRDDDAHPFTTDRGIADFIDQLPASQAGLALDAISECFENAAQLPLDAAQRRHALSELDLHAYRLTAELWHVLTEATQGEKINEAAWQAMYRYYGRMQAGFRLCLEQMEPRGKWSEDDIRIAASIAIRAMAALMRRNLLMRIRYRAPTDDFWQDVNWFYVKAEATGVLRIVLEAYEDTGEATSALREYLAGVLLEVAPHGSLMPVQLICLDHMLRHFGNLLAMREEPDEHAAFFSDLTKNRPPERYLPGLPGRERCRYFGIGAARRYFETMLVHANEGKPMPDWVVASGIEPRRYHELLERVLPQWSTNPPRRVVQREPASGELQVVHGFSLVRRMLSCSEFARSGNQIPDNSYSTKEAHNEFSRIRFDTVQMHASQLASMAAPEAKPKKLTPLEVLGKLELVGDKDMMGTWKITDASTSGLGAIVSKLLPWVRVGMLIGFRRKDDIEWRPAVIRRRGRDTSGNQVVGVQHLGWPAASVRVRPLEEHEKGAWDQLPGAGEGFHEAIFIEAEPMMLVVSPGFFQPGRDVLMRARSRFHNVRLVAMIESGTDYELVTCEIQAKA